MLLNENQKFTLQGIDCFFVRKKLKSEDVPAGFFKYELRAEDVRLGRVATVETHVVVNFAGTILAKQPLKDKDGCPLDKSHYLARQI